jgi:hypothetical protein
MSFVSAIGRRLVLAALFVLCRFRCAGTSLRTSMRRSKRAAAEYPADARVAKHTGLTPQDL